MKIVKFKVEIFNDTIINTENFYKLLSEKLSEKFGDHGVNIIISRKMISKLNYLNCNYTVPIRYLVNYYIGDNDVFISPYYDGDGDDIRLSGNLILKYYRKYYRKEKLKEICSKEEIK